MQHAKENEKKEKRGKNDDDNNNNADIQNALRIVYKIYSTPIWPLYF